MDKQKCKQLIEELQALVDDWSVVLHSDSPQTRASDRWMQYETENTLRAKHAKKLKKLLAKYGEDNTQ